MAVAAQYYSTRDPHRTMFADKKAADAHDRLLEATEEVAAVIEQAETSVDADQAYRIAAALVAQRDALMLALKKAPRADNPAPPVEEPQIEDLQVPQTTGKPAKARKKVA